MLRYPANDTTEADPVDEDEALVLGCRVGREVGELAFLDIAVFWVDDARLALAQRR